MGKIKLKTISLWKLSIGNANELQFKSHGSVIMPSTAVEHMEVYIKKQNINKTKS